MPKPIVISLQENEAAALLQLIDFAVRGTGMQTAEIAVGLNKKIIAAAEAAGYQTQRVPVQGPAAQMPPQAAPNGRPPAR